MRSMWVKSPSPSEWCVARPAAWTASVGAPTRCSTGTCSAYEPATALMALSSPTPKVEHTTPTPFILA
ncbi:Uncharacterised protein [Mycobacteroides abscessus subsp. abscessus]|nr:Uncharacterised protein [Mycobacteroides abscessus subsp. abscessus]